MADNTLSETNEKERGVLNRMYAEFNAAIGKADVDQTNMITSLMGTNESRRLCNTECSKGWSSDSNSWVSKIMDDSLVTTDTQEQGLTEAINSCKTGCDLKWPGQSQSSADALGAVNASGLYISATGAEHKIRHCADLAQYAPKTNCVVSDYSWTSCSKDCGPGTSTGTRTIITEPQNGGKACPALSKTKPCQDKPCPIDCVVSDYSDWGSCSKDCGPGTKTSTRTVTTAAKYGGKACPVLSKTASCQDKPCATDCEVSAFSGWSECSKDCGPGTQTSTRTVTSAPQNGGKACPSLSQSQSCNKKKCTSVRITTAPFGGGTGVTSDYECKNRPDGNGQIHNTVQSEAHATDSDCVASDQCMLQITADCGLRTHMQDRCTSARNWDDWGNWVTDVGDAATNHGCSSTIISESFVGGRKEGFWGGTQEGYTPLQGDFVKACEDAGTVDGKQIPGTTAPGNSLVNNRAQAAESSNRLKSTQEQIKKSINQMQSQNLGINSAYKTQNIMLLKKLASYETASQKLLNMGTNFDTLNAQKEDSILRKNSVDLSYYLWLSLAISILGVAITKIK